MKPIVIAGNGPSLKDIDYKRLPKDYDIFRCNDFFYEDKFYLGRTVTQAQFARLNYARVFSTLYTLEKNNVYKVENLSMIVNFLPNTDVLYEVYFKYIKKVNKDYLWELSDKLLELSAVYMYQDMCPTSGVQMLMNAVCKYGYTDIYLVGIDLFSGTSRYAFESNELPTIDPFHSAECDLEFIKVISSFPNVRIQTACPTSPICDHIPLAEIQNDIEYIVESKNDDEKTAREPILQEQREQKGIKQKIKNIFIKKDLIGEWEFIRQNSLVRLIYQTIKLPYIILKIIIKLIK